MKWNNDNETKQKSHIHTAKHTAYAMTVAVKEECNEGKTKKKRERTRKIENENEKIMKKWWNHDEDEDAQRNNKTTKGQWNWMNDVRHLQPKEKEKE